MAAGVVFGAWIGRKPESHPRVSNAVEWECGLSRSRANVERKLSVCLSDVVARQSQLVGVVQVVLAIDHDERADG